MLFENLIVSFNKMVMFFIEIYRFSASLFQPIQVKICIENYYFILLQPSLENWFSD